MPDARAPCRRGRTRVPAGAPSSRTRAMTRAAIASGVRPEHVDVDGADRPSLHRVDHLDRRASVLHGDDREPSMGPARLPVLDVRPARAEDGARVDEEASAGPRADVGEVNVAAGVVPAPRR